MAEIELEINDDDLDVIVEIATKPLEDSAKKVNEILNGLRKTTEKMGDGSLSLGGTDCHTSDTVTGSQ